MRTIIILIRIVNGRIAYESPHKKAGVEPALIKDPMGITRAFPALALRAATAARRRSARAPGARWSNA